METINPSLNTLSAQTDPIHADTDILNQEMLLSRFDDESKTNDQKTFESLLGMMWMLKYTDQRLTESMIFITESAALRRCSVRNLCDRFKPIFDCNDQSQLQSINVRRCGLRGKVDLSHLPATVESVYLEDNRLQGIVDLKDLSGSSLRVLNIDRNPNLRVDLSILENPFDPIRLEKLTLSFRQIVEYLGVTSNDTNTQSVRQCIREWIQVTKLKDLLVKRRYGHGRSRYEEQAFHGHELMGW